MDGEASPRSIRGCGQSRRIDQERQNVQFEMNKPNAEIFCNWKNEFLQFFCYTSLIALRFSSRCSFGYLCNGLSKKILYEQIQIEGLISLQSNVNNSLGQTPPDTRKSGFSIESLMEPYLPLFLIVGLSLASFHFAAAESAFFLLNPIADPLLGQGARRSWRTGISATLQP